MTYLGIYLAIGAGISLLAVFAKTSHLPPVAYAFSVLVVIVFWPVCLVGGYLKKRRQAR